MPPLALVLIGQALVIVDLRIGSVDLLPDPLGWAITTMALLRLTQVHRLFPWAVGFAVAAGVVSIADWLRPLTTIDLRTTDPGTISVAGLLDLSTIYQTLVALVVILTSFALGGAAEAAGEARSARAFRAVGWAHIGIEFLGVILVGLTLSTRSSMLSAALAVFLIVAVVAAMVWWLVLLWKHRLESWTQPVPAFSRP